MTSAGGQKPLKCCIAGGGPAGMVLGYLLARAGVPVTIFEKHADFLRDFRGDTVHPSTLHLLDELGLLDEFLALPHQQIQKARGVIGDYEFTLADFSTLATRCKFIALMPQWHFLNFFARHGQLLGYFNLRMEHEVVDLLREGGRVAGVVVKTAQGLQQVQADLVIACDGRHSTLRQAAGLSVVHTGVPIDVLWFRISRPADSLEHLLGNINYGTALVAINRGDYFQCGLIVKKGSFAGIQAQGLGQFRQRIARVAPFLADHVDEISSWQQVKLLSVQINHVRQWYLPGLLLIGDAAHAMSPAGGVGINYAVQDAVATANLLVPALRRGAGVDGLLPLVQRRREPPTRAMQFLQMLAHCGLASVFANRGPMRAPWQMKLVLRLPGVQWLGARVVGLGLRPEHFRRQGQPRRTHYSMATVACLAGIGAVCLLLRRRTR